LRLPPPAYYGSDSLIQAFGIGHRGVQCQIGLLVQSHVNHGMTAGKDDDHGMGRTIGGEGMKRSKHPPLSVDGEQALAAYTQYLQQEQDLRPATQRSYLSELRLFIAWYEHTWSQGQEAAMDFTPPAIATPAVTQYRSYLQTVLRLKPTTINRCLVGLKRYFAWAAESGVIQRDPARIVKLLPLPSLPPRHLSDQEENALMAAVTTHGSPRSHDSHAAPPYRLTCHGSVCPPPC